MEISCFDYEIHISWDLWYKWKMMKANMGIRVSFASTMQRAAICVNMTTKNVSTSIEWDQPICGYMTTSYGISFAFRNSKLKGSLFRVFCEIKTDHLVYLTSQEKPESTVSRGNIPLGTLLPSYGPIHVPAGIYSLEQTPSLCPGMLDRHSWTSLGNDIMEYVISMSSISSLSSPLLSIPTVNKIFL